MVFGRQSTFHKLILLFLVIILPIIILGTIAIQTSSRRLYNETRNSVQIQMKHYFEEFIKDIDYTQDLAFDLLQNKDINQLAKIPNMYDEYKKSVAVLNIIQKLSVIKSSSTYVSNVRVLMPSLGWAINAEGYKGGSYTEISGNEIKRLAQMIPLTKSYLLYRDGRLTMPIVSYDNVNDKLLFMVEIEFSKPEISGMLARSMSFKDSRFILYMEKELFELDDFKPEEEELKKQVLRAEQVNTVEQIKYGGVTYSVFQENSDYLEANFIWLIPKREMVPPVETLTELMILFFAAVIVCICFYCLMTYRMIHRPLLGLVSAFRTVEKGDFSIRLESKDSNDFGYLYREFNQMSANLEVLINEVYNQKMLTQKANLKQLQAQINPHFLYNSYFLLHRLIKKEDYEKAVSFSKEMGTYFKYITRNNADVVNLGDENEHAMNYVKIQAMRFEGRIKVEYEELPQDLRNISVPRLIIQPILENAFQYGLENKAENGLLRIHFETIPQGAAIFIEDNGEELTDADIEKMRDQISEQGYDTEALEVTGIVNISRRIRIFCGNEGRLYVSRSSLGGLCVEVRIIRNDTGQ